MQHTSHYIVSIAFCLFFCTAAVAQKDSTHIVIDHKDSLLKYDRDQHLYKDPLHKKFSRNGSIYHADDKEVFKSYDSAIKVNRHFEYMKKDSAFKQLAIERKKYVVENRVHIQRLDSLRKINIKAERFKRDSAFKSLESLHALRYEKIGRKGFDSLVKMKVISHSFNRDSGFKRSAAERKQLYLNNLRTDSVRLKKLLKFRTDPMQLWHDSLNRGKKYVVKVVSLTMACKPGTAVFINDNIRKVVIDRSNSDEVRLSTKVNYPADQNYSDAEWFSKMQITLTKQDSGIVIDIQKQIEPHTKLIENMARPLTISLPENIVLHLNNSNAETVVQKNIETLTATLINGKLKTQNVNDMNVRAKYSTVESDLLRNATADLINCNFSADVVMQLTIASKNSLVRLGNTNSLAIKSYSDQYELATASIINGEKNFGKLDIDQLNDQLVLSGNNTDVHVKTFGSNTSLVKISSKYAALNLPVYALKNYEIHYQGSEKSIANTYSATQQNYAAANTTLVNNVSVTGVNKKTFEAAAGNKDGKHTKTQIACDFCNVVFN